MESLGVQLVGSSAATQQQPVAAYSTGVAHLNSLQALRALAATTVIFDHIPFARWGSFGVDIFFVLSGFVICHITATDKQHFFPSESFVWCLCTGSARSEWPRSHCLLRACWDTPPSPVLYY